MLFKNWSTPTQATVYFDSILTTNAKLREEIERLQCQKTVYDNIYARLHKKLEQQKMTMEASIEQSTHAFEQRWEGLDSGNISYQVPTHQPWSSGHCMEACDDL